MVAVLILTTQVRLGGSTTTASHTSTTRLGLFVRERG